MRRTPLHLVLAACLFVSLQAPVRSETEPDRDGLAVDVRKKGDMVVIDVTLVLPADPHETWDVLTDYDHMVDFLRNLQFSKIVEGSGNRIQVAQKGRARFGLLLFPFDTVREVELKPYYEIRSHVIKGSIKRGEGTTRLIPDGSGTRIVYHNETVSSTWLPPGLGPAIVNAEVRAQFQDLKNEILRRKAEKQRIGSLPQG